MTNYQIIRRLEIILHLLSGYPMIGKAKLLERLAADYDIQITTRTLERDFAALKSDLRIEVNYDQQAKGYFLSEEDVDQIQSFTQFAGRIFLGDLLHEGLKNYPNLKTSIKFQGYNNFKGIEHLPQFLLAIKEHLKINFIHENYQKKTNTKYIISPFQIREYQGRWYITGLPEGEPHIKTFGLDRIKSPKILGVTPVKREDFSAQLAKFDAIIGLNYDESESREIVHLAVTQNQYKYLKALPLHLSQKEEGILSDGRVKISLYVFPNFELELEILKLGDQVEVLAPLSLRNHIKNILSNGLKHYKNG